MREVLGEHPQYGYRQLAQELRRRGVLINEKRIRRLHKEFHFLRLSQYPWQPKMQIGIALDPPAQNPMVPRG